MDTERLIGVLAVHCATLGVEVLDAELLRGGAGGRSSSVLRVTVDRDGAALDLDGVAAVSVAVSEALDANEPLAPPGQYDLEVSSPGVERRLRRPAQFNRAVGQQVSVTLVPGAGAERHIEGTLVAADEGGVTLSTPSGESRLALGDIEQARTVFDWRAALASAGRRQETERVSKR